MITNPVIPPDLIRLGQIPAEDYLREVTSMPADTLARLLHSVGIQPGRGAEAILRRHCEHLASYPLQPAA